MNSIKFLNETAIVLILIIVLFVFFLGKIVNMIRRFPDMRDDLIHNEFIAIPQYYASGVICVTKKPTNCQTELPIATENNHHTQIE